MCIDFFCMYRVLILTSKLTAVRPAADTVVTGVSRARSMALAMSEKKKQRLCPKKIHTASCPSPLCAFALTALVLLFAFSLRFFAVWRAIQKVKAEMVLQTRTTLRARRPTGQGARSEPTHIPASPLIPPFAQQNHPCGNRLRFRSTRLSE